MSSNRINVNLAFNAETGKAKKQIQELQTLLNKIAYSGTTASPANKTAADLRQAAEAAKQLQYHLNNAFNVKTGNFDLSLLDRSLKSSKANITDLSRELLKAGQSGQQAFLGLAQSISLADQPMLKISNRLKELGVSLKNAVKWQLSSSIVHGFMGSIQSAYGYAQDLNESLNNIRIVTGYNVDKMAEFADQANKAAKALSTTTTEYTDASLIYFQQGLSDADVKKRTDTTIKLANVTGQTVEETANQMTAIWNNFDDGSKSLEYYADVITALGAATASSSKEISEGLNKFSAVAESVGLSYEYASAALATVTATTRQSADIVGNAFKTLFARIQGLNLGETLDDGTTLNKYSQALFKVGIDIKDQSGQLKDMNTILDEMGSKWGTLNKDQQIALAQTVAGVRQYTQLVALMDNWDFFQQNLGTALGSEGALTKQANIYAESWEAASKRVKASAESIFQNLIDDKFFISINNGLANLLTGIKEFIKGIGGAQGVLSGIISIIMTNFADKLPQTIDNIRNNLTLLIKSSQDTYQNIQNDLSKVMEEQFQKYEITQGQSGIDKNSAMGYAIEQANKLTIARNQLASMSDKMSDSEKQLYNMELSIIDATQQEAIALKQKNEQLKQNIDLNIKSLEQDVGVDNAQIAGESLGNAVSKKLFKAFEDSSEWIGLTREQISYLGEAGGETAQILQTEMVKALKELQKNGRNASKVSQQFTADLIHMKDASGNGSQQLTILGQMFSSIRNNLPKSVDADGLNVLRNQMLEFINILPIGIQQTTGVRQAIQGLQVAGDLSTLVTNFNTLESALGAVQINTNNVNNQFRNFGENSVLINNVINSMRNLVQSTTEEEEAVNKASQVMDNFNPQKIIRMSEAFGNLTGLMTGFGFGLRSLKSTIETISNPELSGWEKFSSLLISLPMVLTSFNNVWKNTTNLMNFGAQSLAKLKAGTIAYQIAQHNLNHAGKDFNQTIQTLFGSLGKGTKLLNDQQQAEVAATLREELLGKAKKGTTAALIAQNVKTKENTAALTVDDAQKVIDIHLEQTRTKEIWNYIIAKKAAKVAILGVTAALVAAIAVAALVISHQKKIAKQTEENAKIARENAEKTKEQTDTNQELVESYENALNTYNEVKKAFEEGNATSEEFANAQENLADTADKVALALDTQGSALARLSGDYDELTGKIIENQKAQLESAIIDQEDAKSKSGLEFISKMREGKGGYDLDGGYSAEFGWSGQATRLLRDLDYSKYQTIRYAPGNRINSGSLIIETEQTVEGMIKAYEEAQNLYNYLLQIIPTDQQALSKGFQDLQAWLNKAKEPYEAYKAAEKNIKKFEIQKESLSTFDGINLTNISSLEEYEKFYNELINQIADSKGIDSGTDAWNDLTESVQAYLVTQKQVSKFATQSKALDEIAEKTKIAKEELLKYYTEELKTEEDKELFFKISFNRTDSIDDFKDELKLLQTQADEQKIQVKLDIISQGLDLFDKDVITTEEITDWAKQMREEYGKEFNLQEFLGFTEDEQKQYLKNLQIAVEEERILNRQNQITELENANDRINIQLGEMETDYKKSKREVDDKTRLLNRLQTMKEEYQEASNNNQKYEFESINMADYFDGIDGTLQISSIDEIDRYIEAAQKTISQNSEVVNSYEELNDELEDNKQIIEDLNAEKDIETSYGWREDLQKEAKSLDIDYNKVKEYAQYLREIGTVKVDDYQGSEEMALARLKQQQAIEGLTKSSENYLEVLKQLPDTIDDNTVLSYEQKQAIAELVESFANLTGLEKDVFNANFIASNDNNIISALQDLQDGAKGAAEQLAILLAVAASGNDDNVKAFGDILLEAVQGTQVGEAVSQEIINRLGAAYGKLSEEQKKLADQMLVDSGLSTIGGQFIKIFESAGLEDWQIELKKSAEAVGLNYTEVQKYAELLKQLGIAQGDVKAEKMALEWMKQDTALEKLNSGAKKYAEILALVAEKGESAKDLDWLDTVGELQKYFSMLTGAEASVFDEAFLLSDSVQQALSDMANGIEGSMERLQGLLQLKISFDPTEYQVVKNLFNQIAQMDIEIGVTLSEDKDDILDTLYNFLLKKIGADEAKNFFKDYLGFDISDVNGLTTFTKVSTETKKTIEDLAKEVNIAYEDVQEYAKLLIQTGRATEETAESMALAIMKQSKGFDELSDKAEEYIKNLKGINTSEITGDQSKYINDLADSLALLIGVEKEAFGDNLAGFIASPAVMAAIEALNNGVEGSIEDLILLASLQVSTYGKNFNQEQTDTLKNFGNKVKEESQEIGIGETSDVLTEFFSKISNNEETAQAAKQLLKDFGFIVQNGKVIKQYTIPALEEGKSEIEKLSDSLGVSYDSVKKNAEILRTLYPELKNNEELSERMALAGLAQSEAIKDLTDNYEDYINILNTAEKGSAEYLQAYQALTNDLSKITGITDTDILKSLINDQDIQDALAKVARGDEGSIGEVRILAGVKLALKDNITLDDNLVQQLIEFNNSTVEIPVGFKLKDDADEILESLYSELLKAGWENEKIQSFFNDIIGYAIEQGENGDLDFIKIKDTSSESIQAQANAADINYDEVQEYAKILREQNSALKDNIKLSEKMALSYLRTKKGVDKITNSFDDWTDAIKNGNKDIIRYQKTLDEIKDTYKDVFNSIDPEIIEQLGDEFLTSSQMMDLMSKAASGDEQAWNDWEAAVLQRVNETASAFSYMTDDMKSQMTELTTMAANLDFSGLTPGADIQDEAFLTKLAQMEFATAEAAQVMCDNLSSVGVDAKIVPHEREVEGYTANTTQKGSFSFFDEANQQVGTISFEGGATEIKEPHKETFYTLEGATYNGKGVRPAAASSNKGGGGGGGSSAPKHAEKKSTGDKTRYHTLQNQLEDLKAEYDSISEAADRAFGKDKLKAIDSEINKTDELINKQKEYVDAIKANLPVDKAVMDAYYTDLIGGNIQYDERGNISNYDAIQDAMFNKYNQMTEMYDEDSQEWQVFEKKYEQLEKYIEQYEETYDLLRDEEEAYQDLLRQRIDLKLEKIQYSVEVQLEIPDNEIAVLEYKLGKIEDDAFKSAEAIGLLTREAEAVYDQIQINKQGLNDVLKLSLSTQEILQLMSGDTSVLANKTFTADQIEAIKEYRDSLLDLNGQFDDMRETIEEKVMEVFDAWNEKLDSGISKLDHYGNILQSYKNIIDIVGKDTLGLTDTFMATLNQSSIDNAINKLSSTKKSYEVMIDAQSKAEQALEEAKARNDESSIKMWEENLQSITEEAESAREEMLSAWEEALNGVAEQFEATVERVVDIFNKEVYTLGGLEGLSEDFSNQQEKADIMLDDYQKIYELSKLNRDINKSINDIDSLSGKQKLKKLLEQINALQEDGLEMSQYDLDYLQKTYDLRMAEIELEEARNAKNTVRLRKDNEGNWSYVYTQNMDAVDTAQQKYEDALYAMQEVSSNYIDEMSEKLISTSQEMEEALAAIRIQDFASIDDYYAEVQRVQQQYEEELLMQQNELQKAIDNNKILYDQDWTNYHNATGYKISDTENFATTFRDTLLGSLLGSEEDTANFTDIIGSAVDTLTQGLMTGDEIYYANLEAAMNAAGTSTGNFAEDTAANIDAVVEKSIEGAEAVDQMAIEMIDAFSEITNSVQNWQESYGTAMQAIIDSNLAVIESFNQMLEALSIDPNSITVKYDLINSNNAPQQFASGRYTGEWGNYGKLAILDEKELILNQNDTTNFLKALGIAQTILDTIDLNATQASYGFGNLVPATINENNSQTIEQDVHITAEFPNATDKNEIEQAFETLINKASQYANRR